MKVTTMLMAIIGFSVLSTLLPRPTVKTRTITYEEQLFGRKIDTLVQIIQVVGKALTVDEADKYKAYGIGVLQGFYRDSKIDSIKSK